MAKRNGEGTFSALKREMVNSRLVGHIRSVGEVVALYELLVEQRQQAAVETRVWFERMEFINDHRLKAGIEVDSLIKGHEEQCCRLLRSMWRSQDASFHRDIMLIEHFLDARGVTY